MMTPDLCARARAGARACHADLAPDYLGRISTLGQYRARMLGPAEWYDSGDVTIARSAMDN